jgi:hypothetical protein
MESCYTIRDFLLWLAPQYINQQRVPSWPPDLFAICATLLAQTGGYYHVAQDWPPIGKGSWERKIERIAEQWQREVPIQRVPRAISARWKILLNAQSDLMSTVSKNRKLCLALIELCAIADSACCVIDSSLWTRPSLYLAIKLVEIIEDTSRQTLGATLCSSSIDPLRARVLPRCRTPQRGLTIRSLSHYLALIRGNEIVPRWRELPALRPESPENKVLNVLLAPWPLSVSRRCFTAAPQGRGQLANLAPSFRFFDFDPSPINSSSQDVVTWLEKLYSNAIAEVPTIELVILPELALNPTEMSRVLDWARTKRTRVIAGVGQSGQNDRLGENYVVFGDPILTHSNQAQQRKHHRWLLDRSQIETYGLGAYLDPRVKWWEPIELKERSLELITLTRSNLTICALVCEDLTQQEPASELIRAVGPNLVVALLMDGPQLASRWPARYAAVLADDPGSSVLTLTSLGMCERSRPFGTPPSRTIGLWRDGCSGHLRELVLPPRAEGIVLNLLLEEAREYTADGRRDQGVVVNPRFVGSFEVST